MTKSNITAVCKTFFRPESLNYLLESYGKYQQKTGFKFHEILIADDSDDETKLKNKDLISKFKEKYSDYPIRYLDLEFDSGLSIGRNELLKETTTEFFLLLDDDFIFNSDCDMNKPINMIKEKELDILGGHARNLNISKKKIPFDTNFFGLFNKIQDEFTAIFIKDHFPEFSNCDIINNFFIGRTSSIKAIGWLDALKVGEHEEFFIRAKIHHNIKVAYSNTLFINHYPIRSVEYSKFRDRFSSNDRVNIMNDIKLKAIKKLTDCSSYSEMYVAQKRVRKSVIKKTLYPLTAIDYKFGQL